jgi:hypothetical protein
MTSLPDSSFTRGKGLMKSSTRLEIERIVGNRDSEAHPFKRNGAGLKSFSRMLSLVDLLAREEIEEFLLPKLDDLLLRLKNCFSCQAKLLAFAEIYCSRKNPRKATTYRKQYQKHLSQRREDTESRDYRAEVHKAIGQYGEQRAAPDASTRR